MMDFEHEVARMQAAGLKNFTSDYCFVEYVRLAERASPSLTNMVVWRDEVRKELDFRLLLKKAN